MKSFLILPILYITSLGISGQRNIMPDFDIFLGIGRGIGAYDKSLSQYNNLNNINHLTHFAAIEVTSAFLPFSLEYDVTASNYTRKMNGGQTSSLYTLHKAGIGLKLKRNIPLKIKYLINNQFHDYSTKPSLGMHLSIGLENSFLIGNISKNKRLNMTFRLMAYYEGTFGDLSSQDMNVINVYNIKSPYRHAAGISLWLKPWLNKKHQNEPSTILPPY